MRSLAELGSTWDQVESGVKHGWCRVACGDATVPRHTYPLSVMASKEREKTSSRSHEKWVADNCESTSSEGRKIKDGGQDHVWIVIT